VKLGCHFKHIYHEKCIEDWFRQEIKTHHRGPRLGQLELTMHSLMLEDYQNVKCPLCKKSLVNEDFCKAHKQMDRLRQAALLRMAIAGGADGFANVGRGAMRHPHVGAGRGRIVLAPPRPIGAPHPAIGAQHAARNRVADAELRQAAPADAANRAQVLDGPRAPRIGEE